MRKSRLNAGVKPPGEPLKNPFRRAVAAGIIKGRKKALKMGDEMQVDVLPDTLDVYINRIDSAIEDFCLRYDIQSLKRESQNTFVACLMYVYRQVFKPPKPLLKNRKSVLDYERDIDIIDGLLDYYIFICGLYDKTVSQYEFIKLIGLSDERLYDWKNGNSLDNELTLKKSNITKRLFKEREQSLSNTLTNGKSPIGTLAILNHFYSWSLPGVSREEVKPRLTRNELLQGLDALPEKPLGIDSSDE